MSCASRSEPNPAPPAWKTARAKLWSFDTETFPIQAGLPSPALVVGSWADDEGEWIGDTQDTRQFFVGALERGDHLVGINLAFDIVVMVAMWPELLPLVFKAGNAGQFHDCSIREGLNDIALGALAERPDGEDWNRYGMTLLMERHFKTDISAEKKSAVRVGYGHLAGIPISQWQPEERDYPKRDARRTYDICRRQAGSVERGWKRFRNLHDEPAQVRASIAVQLMRTWGFRTDGEYIADLEQKVDKLWDEARTEFTRAGIFRADGTKDKKFLGLLVSKAYGGKPPPTPSGQICTDRDTLEESGDPLLVKLGTSGKNDKRKTTYIPALKQGIDWPVTPNVCLLTATGRISCDWQQMPQKGLIREGIRARPGTVISSNDLGGAELRTMSQRAIRVVGFSKMADFLNQGKDVHAHVGATFLGITFEEFMRRKAELDSERKVAKIFNFGKGGGAGAFAMAYNAKVKENIRFCLSLKRATVCGVNKVEGKIRGQAKRMCALCVKIAGELGELWLRAWPEQQLLKDMAGKLTAKRRRADSLTFGSERLRGNCTFSQWLNNPFQGAIGDAVKAAMWKIEEESKTDRRSALWGSHTILNIHDELWVEHPDDSRRHDGAHRVAQILCEETDRVTPDVKNEVEPAIARRPFKAMTKTVDRNGRLRPWWPKDWNWQPDQEQMCADLAA